ncbi:MAG: transglutaminaseTgpA domain-containing protein [Rubrobacteraceae bacterium]|nr:transglutaminase domain-containing protein [Rubrobacter sp.]
MNAPSVRVSLYVAVLAAGGAFGLLFTGDSFGGFAISDVPADRMGAFFTMLGAALVALLVGSSGRYRFVLILPSTAAYTLLVVYGWPPLFSLRGWRELFWEIGTDVYDAAGIMYMDPVPYDLAPGLFVVLIPVVMIVAAFATSATLYEESPVVSVAVLGLTIGVLSTVGFEVGTGPYFALFLVSAVALLLAAGSSGAFPRTGVMAGAFVVALVLVLPRAPLSDATVSGGLIDWTRIGTGGTSQLDVQADVGDYLTSGRDAELLRIRSEEPLRWRAGTLDYFDGFQWRDTTEPKQGYGEEVNPMVEANVVRQDVEVLDAQTDRIFGGYRIVNTSLDNAEENTDGSWSIDGYFDEGSSYWLLSEVPQPTKAQLRNAGSDYPASVREKYLQLPSTTPSVVAERAREVERRYDPATPYDRARAIERYLRYDGGFVYNLDVSYRRADTAVEEFLSEDGKQGFCTQFATSMALIAREMDLPSRVVYGATQGEEVEPDEYVVTGHNMHTWVEIYFPGVGWYPMDPTPGFSMPTTMERNAPAPQVSAATGEFGREQITQRLRRQAEQQQQTPEKRRNTPNTERNPAESAVQISVWPFVVLATALLVAAVPLTKRALLARGRPEDMYRDLVARLRDVLPPGRAVLANSPALTPTERVLLLAGAAGVEEEPFAEFARVYSDHLYSAGPSLGGARNISAAHREAVEAFQRMSLWRRALGAVNPSSLLMRARRSLAVARTRAGKSLRRLREKLHDGLRR